MKFAEKLVGYQAPTTWEFDMSASLFSNACLAAFSRVALSLALAFAIPQLIVSAAPPAPGTLHAFLVWF